MTPLLAQLRTDQASADQRSAPRRRLKLVAGSQGLDAARPVLIHNLSESGLLIETSAPLKVGEVIDVEFAETGATAARIVRAEGDHYGCRFVSPISRGAVSAALLRSPIDRLPAPPSEVPKTADNVREDLPIELGAEISLAERVLLYAVLILAAVAVATFIHAIFSLAIVA